MRRRSGSALVETALAVPVFFLGLGGFFALAREVMRRSIANDRAFHQSRLPGANGAIRDRWILPAVAPGRAERTVEVVESAPLVRTVRVREAAP